MPAANTIVGTTGPRLQPLETFAPGDVSLEAIWGTEGLRMREAAMARMAEYPRRFASAVDLMARARAGDWRSVGLMQEAMSTSDFPLLFGDVLSRTLEPAYNAWPSMWQSIAAADTVPDFRPVSRLRVDGGDQRLAQVGELVDYPVRGRGEGLRQYSVTKYGAVIEYSWETQRNDDLGALMDQPRLLGQAAAKTEDHFVTSLVTDANGPDATFYSVANDNLVTGQPPLSYNALKAALTQLAERVDPVTGEPIFLSAITLMVGPGLMVAAEELLKTTHFDVTDGSGNVLRINNWLTGTLNLVVNPWIPVIATANADTSWWLFGPPNEGRPAVIFGRLRGSEAPELFLKDPGSLNLAGAQLPASVGSFPNDSIAYKVRHALGGTTGDPIATVASNGTP